MPSDPDHPPPPIDPRRPPGQARDDPSTAARHASLGDQLYRQGLLAGAFDQYSAAHRLQPANADFAYKFACAARALDRLDLAGQLFEETLRLQPAQLSALIGLGQVHLQLGNREQALVCTARAIEQAPQLPEAQLARAWVLESDRRPDEAAGFVRRLLAAGNSSASLAALYVRLARHMGEEEQALAKVSELLASDSIGPTQRAALHHELVGMLDRQGKFEQAFSHAAEAHRLGRRPYDPLQHAAFVNDSIRYFTPRKLQSLSRAQAAAPRPVFIVGMPRSGTSLVEQILASHPDVHGAGELDDIARVMQTAQQSLRSAGKYPDCLDALRPDEADRLARLYTNRLRSLSATATIVTDKMPLNFLSLGFLGLLFPNAQVIHCVRDPLDTCLSCYLTSLQHGIAFTHDLGHLAAFYRDYRRLMDRWRAVLTIPMLEIRYEQVVQDTEGEARRMTEFLGLPWDARCLRFHENPRHVGTSSAGQVRTPIYRSSIGRWRQYEPRLGELVTALRESGCIELPP